MEPSRDVHIAMPYMNPNSVGLKGVLNIIKDMKNKKGGVERIDSETLKIMAVYISVLPKYLIFKAIRPNALDTHGVVPIHISDSISKFVIIKQYI